MAIEGYEGYDGASQRTRWGCGVAALVGLLLFAFLAFVDALGECRPGDGCRHGFLGQVLAPGAIAALIAFFAAHAVAGRLQRRRDRR